MEYARQLRVNLYGKPIGGTIELEIVRDGRARDVRVSVVERADDPARFGDLVDPRRARVDRLGILGVDLNRELRSIFGGQLRSESGVIEAAVLFSLSTPGTGLVPGGVIRSVGDRNVGSVEDLRAALEGYGFGGFGGGAD